MKPQPYATLEKGDYVLLDGHGDHRFRVQVAKPAGPTILVLWPNDKPELAGIETYRIIDRTQITKAVRPKHKPHVDPGPAY